MAPPKISLAAVCLLVQVLPRVVTAQNITIDGRFSPAQTLIGPSYSIGPNLGRQVGSNLFHSFGQFGLSTGEAATFSGPAAISNVIGRVTGSSQSTINGKIASTIAGASLYLINPSGIVFGPNATVNVSGSFHASTADYLRMSDGAKFRATNPDASTLSAAPPAAFGFLTAQPAALTVNGSTLGPVPGTLGLVAGPISITGGAQTPTFIAPATISAPAGTIHVTSAASPGEVPVDPRNTSALTVTSFGPVAIGPASILDVSNRVNLGSGGSVFIRSGALTIDSSNIDVDNFGSGPGGQLVLRGDNRVTLSNTTVVQSVARSSGNGGRVIISTAPAGVISAEASTVVTGSVGTGNSGALEVSGGTLTLRNAEFSSLSRGSGSGGPITISADAMRVDGGSNPLQSTGIFSSTLGAGRGESITIVAGELTLHNNASVLAQSFGAGAGGSVVVSVGQLAMTNGGLIGVGAVGTGNGGKVSLSVDGRLSIDGSNSRLLTGISSNISIPVSPETPIMVTAEQSSSSGSVIGSVTGSPGSVLGPVVPGGTPGNITVNAGTLSINNGIISASTLGPANAGDITVSAGSLAITNEGLISGISSSASGVPVVDASGRVVGSRGGGNGGSVTVNVAGRLSIDALGSQITSAAGFGAGNAGDVTLSAGSLAITNGGEISSGTFAAGDGGSVTVNVAGRLSIDGGTSSDFIRRSTGIDAQVLAGGTGHAGVVTINAGSLVISNGGEISSDSSSVRPGDAGRVTISAGSLAIANGGGISSDTLGPGNGGSVTVNVAGRLSIDGFSRITSTSSPARGTAGNAGEVTISAGSLVITNGGEISSDTFGPGNGGSVTVNVAGRLSIDGSNGNPAFPTGITSNANAGSTGNAGSVSVTAGSLMIGSGGSISTNSNGSGAGGSVSVTALGELLLDGRGFGNTQIAASATGPRSGRGGSVTVAANALTIGGGAQIASTTAGPGKGGDIAVSVANGVTLSGSGPNGASGISAAALLGSSGAAGEVVLTAGGAIALSGGAIASATSTASGNAGSVMVTAPQITLTTGGEIVSNTAGTGAGGSVSVTTPGALVLDGAGVANTQIAASAIGPRSGPGGSVTITANALTVKGGGQIASTTAGPGKGGDVNITVASDFVLPDPGPQITAQSTGSGDAGSITVSAVRLLMNNGAAISTEAAASTASGGNITLHVRDFLYLTSSEITASVKGETGNGGNITVDPQLAILNHSRIIASAVEGRGGNITINADELIASSDSIFSATGQLLFSGPRVDVNGALVVLSTELRSAAQVLREACAAQGNRPQSSLVEAGRGGLPQDPEATLPALYIAGRDVNPNPQSLEELTETSGALQTTVRLMMRCG
jgi:filamentous hemagglutinin family protein